MVQARRSRAEPEKPRDYPNCRGGDAFSKTDMTFWCIAAFQAILAVDIAILIVYNTSTQSPRKAKVLSVNARDHAAARPRKVCRCPMQIPSRVEMSTSCSRSSRLPTGGRIIS